MADWNKKSNVKKLSKMDFIKFKISVTYDFKPKRGLLLNPIGTIVEDTPHVAMFIKGIPCFFSPIWNNSHINKIGCFNIPSHVLVSLKFNLPKGLHNSLGDHLVKGPLLVVRSNAQL